MSSTLSIPTITTADLTTFHETHLSPHLHTHFSRTFLNLTQSQDEPEHEHEHKEEEEDDLGYYPDGTKRTLTPAQIDMFRFSEIQALQKKRHRAAAKKLAAKERRTREHHYQEEEEEEGGSILDGEEEEEGGEVHKDNRASRLEAAEWASAHTVTDERRQRARIAETVDTSTGRTFMWPVIDRE